MRVISGIQPSGIVHLGNYLGAIKQQIELQDQFDDAIYFIADLHAITADYNPKNLGENILSVTAIYLACGLDLKKSHLFLQSSIPEHSELAWLLLTQTTTGELSRMTQFKEKSGSAQSVPTGIFAYPALMAADILLYKANIVPVGEDQVQHIELTRDIAKRFNNKFGDVFVIPEARIDQKARRIMSLNDSNKKMSKSADSSLSYISLTDGPDEIANKIKRAVTDSGSDIIYSDDKPALKNLLNIFAGVSARNPEDIATEYSGKGYADLKTGLAQAVVEFLNPIQKKYSEFLSDQSELKNILTLSAKQVHPIANKTLCEVKQKMGITF